MKRIKSFLSLFLSVIMLFSICPGVFASDAHIVESSVDSVKTSDFFAPVKKFVQIIISVTCRLFNNLFGKDESNIEKAAETEKSWEEADMDFIIENPETEIKTQTWMEVTNPTQLFSQLSWIKLMLSSQSF